MANIKNDIAKLTSLKEKCETEINRLQKENKAQELSKGGFGFIKENFEMMSPELFKTKEGRAIIREYIDTIKKSRGLSQMHLFYECIRKAPKNCDVNEYINEAKKLICGEADKKEINKSLEKLRKVYERAFVTVGKEDDIIDNKKLNEAVEYIITEKKNTKTLPIFALNMQTIKEFVELNGKDYGNEDTVDVENLVSNFTEKYNDLPEDDVNLVKEICSSNGEEVFNKYKNECITKINEKRNHFAKQGDDVSLNKLDIICEKVSAKQYNPNTIGSDIYNLFGITKCITD